MKEIGEQDAKITEINQEFVKGMVSEKIVFSANAKNNDLRMSGELWRVAQERTLPSLLTISHDWLAF